MKQSEVTNKIFLNINKNSSLCDTDGKVNKWRPLINSDESTERNVSAVISKKKTFS